MNARVTRTMRGLAAAAVATLLAACSHTIAGGPAPLGAGTAIAFAFAALVCIALAGRRLSLWRLSLSVVTSQLAFHVLFGVTGTAPVTLDHHGDVTDGMLAVPPMPMHSDSGMLAAHLLAAVVTIAALHRGESALRSLGELLASLVRSVWVVLSGFRPLARPLGVPTSTTIELPHPLDAVLSSMRHRGPPVALASL